MKYQEQEVLALYTVMSMTFLVIAYLITLIVGLYIFTNQIDIKPAETIKYKSISLKHKSTKDFKIPVKPKQELNVVSKDEYLLAQIINAEAGNQPYDGKVAVGNVIMNRVDHPKFPDTIEDVVYQEGQFSPVTDGSINKKPNSESLQAAKDVMNGKKVVRDDVLFFYNPDISTSEWIFTRKVITKIGSHAFTL